MISSPTIAHGSRRELAALSVVGSMLVAFTWLCLEWNPGSLVLGLGFLVAAAFLIVTPARPELGVVGLVAAAALDINGRVFTVAGVQFTVYQLGALAMIAFAIWRVRTGRSHLVRTPLDVPLTAFLTIATLSVLLAADSRRALVALVSLLSSALLVYIVVTLIDTGTRARALVLGITGLGMLWGLAAVAESRGLVHISTPLVLFPDIIRARVTFDDPNVLGEFLIMIALLALPLAITSARVRPRVWFGAGYLLCAAGTLATVSRGALAALLIGTTVALLMVRIPTWKKAALFGGLVLVVVFVALFVLDPGWVQERVIEVAADPSWTARIDMFRAALSISADHPIGVGAANYPLVYPYYRVGDVRASLVESHTMLATILVEYGVVGFLVFMWLLWRYLSRVLLAAIRTRSGMTHAMLTGAFATGVALLAQSFTYSFETSKFLWFVIGFGMSLWRIAGTEIEESS